MKSFTLAAFSAERRAAAITCFSGLQLHDTCIRHLPVDPIKAMGSVRELITRTLEHHRPEFLAIATPSVNAGARVHDLCKAAREIATELGIPWQDVSEEALLKAYGEPPLKRKEHVRKVGRTLWPSINDANAKRASVDSAIVGLYLQTERLFSRYGVEA